jgi:hypothetical protein
MSKLLGKEAYKAARTQTKEKLNPMKQAFIAIVKEGSVKTRFKDTTSTKSTSKTECRE